MKAEINLKSYLLALFVLFLFGISVVVMLISVPYLVFLLFKLFFVSLEFGAVFVAVFWISAVLLLWTVKILSIVSGKSHI